MKYLTVSLLALALSNLALMVLLNFRVAHLLRRSGEPYVSTLPERGATALACLTLFASVMLAVFGGLR